MKVLGYIVLAFLVLVGVFKAMAPGLSEYSDALHKHGIPCGKITTIEYGANGSTFVACDNQTKGYTILNDGRVL